MAYDSPKILYPNGAYKGSIVLMGDSRTSQYITPGQTSIYAVSGINYFSWANANLNYPFNIAALLAISGLRSDQVLATQLTKATQTPAEWAHLGPCSYNDIAQAQNGYSDLFGNNVNLTNVVSLTVANINQMVATLSKAGFRILLSTEWGSTGLTATQSACVFQVNEYLRSVAITYPNVYLWDGAKDLWNTTSSATTIGFRTGYSVDGLHPNYLGGFNLGVSLQNFLATAGALTPIDYLGSNQADAASNNPYQLNANGLFTTQTGGANNGGTLTGAVPGGWNMNAPAGFSYTFSYATNTNGYGNDCSIAITANAAGTAFIYYFVGSGPLLSDQISASMQVDVATGSSNMVLYSSLSVTTNLGTPVNSVFATANNSDVGPTTAYTANVLHRYSPLLPGSTSFTNILHIMNFGFTAAGSATVTMRRGTIRRRLAVLPN